MVSLNLNRWLWKWHVIAGLLSLPFIMLLTFTGSIYLFKADFNNAVYESIKFVEPQTQSRLSLEQQSKYVYGFIKQPISKLILSNEANEATQFQVKSKGRASHIVYVNPYNGEVTGDINQSDTLMQTIRKLHGELLLNKTGTLVVELVASWFIVLLITGLVIWFPFKKITLGGFFSIRFNGSKRLMWRDFHAVFCFWVSLVLLTIIGGAMPWTDVFGNQLKWVQQQTDTGYPQLWRNTSSLKSTPLATKLSFDEMALIAKKQELLGKVTIALPKNEQGVFTVSNRSFWLSDQKVVHIDQYSGEVLKTLTWQDVGILMDIRQVFMRLHQGEYGQVNWWILLISCTLFFTASVSGFVSYLMRRPSGQLGIPKVPDSFKASGFVVLLILLLGVIFPLFGGSVVLILLIQGLMSLNKNKEVSTM